MTAYLIRSCLCMALFLLVYYLVLEKEKMHRFNRAFLLLSLLLSFIVPMISLSTQTPVKDILATIDEKPLTILSEWNSSPIVVQKQATGITEHAFTAVQLLWFIYGVVTLILLVQFILHIYQLARLATRNIKAAYNGATIVLIPEQIASFSFLHFIFINLDEYHQQRTEEAVLTHELAHVNEKHSWDILFVELLRILFWFNPLIGSYKRAIQLNHEYLADDAVIGTDVDVPAYQYLLLEKAASTHHTVISSSFNFTITKKRLIMMTKKANPVKVLFKKTLLLPILTIALFAFSANSKRMAAGFTTAVTKQVHDTTPVRAWERVFTELPLGSGLSQPELDEYNTLVKTKIFLDEGGKRVSAHNTISKEDRARLENLYKKMNMPQRDSARVIFTKTIRPGKKHPPTEANLSAWKNPANYGVWIDEKHISNEELNKYSAADFSDYSASNLVYTEQMKKNVMEQFHLKKMYKVQVDIMTNKYYNAYMAREKLRPDNQMVYHVSCNNGQRVSWSWMIND